MKARHAIFLFVLGSCFNVVGALVKIQHWPGASFLVLAGMGLIASSVFVVLYLAAHSKAGNG